MGLFRERLKDSWIQIPFIFQDSAGYVWVHFGLLSGFFRIPPDLNATDGLVDWDSLRKLWNGWRDPF